MVWRARAEGAWSESYADGPGLRNAFHNAAAFYAAHPAYHEPETLVLCASRPEEGPGLAQALAPIAARAAAAAMPGRLHGYVDAIAPDGNIRGWAWDDANPDQPVRLAILFGGEIVGSVLACNWREDLAQAGFGHGRCSFSFHAPAGRAAEAASVQARRTADGALIALRTQWLAA